MIPISGEFVCEDCLSLTESRDEVVSLSKQLTATQKSETSLMERLAEAQEYNTRLRESLKVERDAMKRLKSRLAEAEALLDSRAGKLLKKGKTFIVVAVDESYFQNVYATIRYDEIDKGRWTEEDELRYRDACKEWIEAAKGGEHGL